MADYVSAVGRACYFQLRQLRVVLQSLTSEAAKSLVHAFISCHLDYCNALLYRIAYYQFQRLQSVLSTERYYEAIYSWLTENRAYHADPQVSALVTD